MVFEKLKKTNYKDPFEPAKQQFDGHGSYGNGGAMRVAPSALFYPKDLDKALEVRTDLLSSFCPNLLLLGC